MVERTDQQWKYPYVAAVVDFGSNLSLGVSKANSRAVGYTISPSIRISSNNPTVIGFLDEFCENHDLNPNILDMSNTMAVEIARRGDLITFLKLVEPYVIARNEAVRIMLKHLLPGLELGKHSTEEGFIQLMGYVDEIREHIKNGNPNKKYTQDYFRDEFGM